MSRFPYRNKPYDICSTENADLRAVERLQREIPWGESASEKQEFLRRSQQRRALGRAAIAMTLIALLAVGWAARTV